jgi:hypothetical protein
MIWALKPTRSGTRTREYSRAKINRRQALRHLASLRRPTLANAFLVIFNARQTGEAAPGRRTLFTAIL